MPRPLKVYGWRDFRPEAPGPHHQTREIVAAKSKSEVQRIVMAATRQAPPLSEITDTSNPYEVSCALSEPGTIFWRGINALCPDPWTKHGTGERWNGPPTPKQRYAEIKAFKLRGQWPGKGFPQWMREIAARVGAPSPGHYVAINAAIEGIVEELLTNV